MPSAHRGHIHTLFFFQKSLRNLFWSAFLRQNGLSLVDIFTLVYVYNTGVTNAFFQSFAHTPFQQGIFAVVATIILLRITDLIVVFPMARIAARVGLPKAAIFGNFLMAIRFGLLAMSIQYPVLIFLAAIFQGIEIAGFTPAYDTMFANKASASKVGRDVGAFMFILKLSHALLPAFAATLIISFGFQFAFIGSMILLLLSNIPLLSMRSGEKLKAPKPSHFLSWLQNKTDSRILLSLAGRYVSDAVTGLWPIYLLFIFGKIERIGMLMSLSLCISLIIIYFSGWYIDHTKKNYVFIFGGLLLAVLWFLRIHVVFIYGILGIEIAWKLAESFFCPSFDAIIYKISKRLDTFAFHVYKEVLVSAVSLLFWIGIGIFFFFFGASWSFVFALAGLGMLTATLLYTARI